MIHRVNHGITIHTTPLFVIIIKFCTAEQRSLTIKWNPLFSAEILLGLLLAVLFWQQLMLRGWAKINESPNYESGVLFFLQFHGSSSLFKGLWVIRGKVNQMGMHEELEGKIILPMGLQLGHLNAIPKASLS